ncbi:hypothetical protein M422DRAFT_254280 [Sphaerobolus stellatus SS14]|uniref:Uncharacterized protein n=1 Tax=Sphaerobolus stellatus (strain SS14) TaxID=990650 RepID=A0A0C9VV90_SPHS4|nr:hypothetical protein M422DRAFT_254280 [Sphaerobolus stellatus SS14]
MPPHREHSPARQERNKKLLIAYIAFNMTQDDEEEEDSVLLALMAWATRKTCMCSVREEVALWEEAARMKQLWAWCVNSTGLIGGAHHRNMGEEEGVPGLVWKRQVTFQASPSFVYQA